jgi:hypothetical protein
MKKLFRHFRFWITVLGMHGKRHLIRDRIQSELIDTVLGSV